MSREAAFDPATLPLDGIRLVEASAGTGKTFSLAGLYLRLIVERGLDVREILVMTFTRAATQELRERLRERLAHAARVAAGPPPVDAAAADTPTAFAEAVIAAADTDRASVARRLANAATRADQATITTIHGFAQRAAAENAFESTLPFDRGDPVDDREIQREAATDYWRCRVFARPAAEAGAFLQLWGSPEALFHGIRPILGQPHARLTTPDAAALAGLLDDARTRWPTARSDLVALLEAAAEHAILKKGQLASWLAEHGAKALAEAIDAGLAGTADGFPGLPPVVQALADDAGVAGAVNQRKKADWFRPQDLPGMALLGRLQTAGRLAAAAHAVAAVRADSERLKRERRLYSFQDMIDGLHAAVTDADRGPALAAALRRTWPWALVDEFQDTDPQQYAILHRLYGTDAHDGGLILIGDPKQAIYGFRGGDVFAYLDAAADAHGTYRMATNFRSAPAVLEGLDALFHQGGPAAFVLEGIDFPTVTPGRAAGKRVVRLDGEPVEGVTAWAVPAGLGPAKGRAEPGLEAATVARIATLLSDGRATVTDTDGERPLAAGDVAVLVNTNAQAAAMQQALSAAGVPAACVQPDSVFGQPAARHVLWLLRAAATPMDRQRLRAVLTTPLFGYRLGDIAALNDDEAQWSALTERLQAAHLRWARHGVQAMAEPVLQAAAARIAGLTDGERRMTDYLHVIDRLQAAEHHVFGMEGLTQWLAEAIHGAPEGEVAEADRLRLDSDGDVVPVITVHKAKGLQFPLVFVPYTPWLGTGGDPGRPPFSYHDDDRRAVIDLTGDDPAARAAALREARAEAVRSLYVALTRAEQACVFTWGALNGSADGPLAWLLHQDDGAGIETWHGSGACPDWLDADTARARLEAVAATSGGALRVEPLPQPEQPPRRDAAAASQPLGDARRDLPAPRLPWSMFSFSGLAGRLTEAAEPAAGADDPADPAADAGDEPAEPEIPLHPRGPGFGQAFHELLETVDFATWPAPGEPPDADQAATVRRALRRHAITTGDADAPAAHTTALLTATLHTPLPGIGPLSAVPPDRRLAEMEFFLHLGGTPAGDILAAIAAAGYAARGGVDATRLRGLMQGFIDLIVERDGQYWVIDYKTNALGPRRADYAPAALREAVRHHHYDLQYLIYTVALHRHLRTTLPDYDPSRHLGGVQYLFVRGMRAGDTETGIHRDAPPVALIEQLDALFDGGEGRP